MCELERWRLVNLSSHFIEFTASNIEESLWVKLMLSISHSLFNREGFFDEELESLASARKFYFYLLVKTSSRF